MANGELSNLDAAWHGATDSGRPQTQTVAVVGVVIAIMQPVRDGMEWSRV